MYPDPYGSFFKKKKKYIIDGDASISLKEAALVPHTWLVDSGDRRLDSLIRDMRHTHISQR